MVNKYITVNTDASFCNSTKVGGYAFWIKGTQLSIKKHGPFKEVLDCSNDAEMKCIANALHSLLCRERLPKAEILVINTDCTGAIHRIKSNRDNISTIINRYINQIKEVTGITELRIKHVKAHVKISDSRSYVNDWCDKQAKYHMRRERRNIYLR